MRSLSARGKVAASIRGSDSQSFDPTLPVAMTRISRRSTCATDQTNTKSMIPNSANPAASKVLASRIEVGCAMETPIGVTFGASLRQTSFKIGASNIHNLPLIARK